MKKLVLLALSLGLLAFGCKDPVNKAPVTEAPLGKDCIKGRIVGQKCGDYAFQIIDSNQTFIHPADWEKATLTGVTLYHNIIGLINLPVEFRVEDKVLFLTVLEPTEAENKYPPCYLDLPVPPGPLYVVTYASEIKCSENN